MTGSWLYDFQTLISGILAILAALGASWAVVWSARLPIRALQDERKELAERRLRYVSLVLGRDFLTLAARARQATGTIRVYIAADKEITDAGKERIYLRLPEIVGDWEFMSILPEQTYVNISRMIRTVEDHNFDIERAGGVFGADNFREQILGRLQRIEMNARALGGSLDMLRVEGRAGVLPQQFDR